MRLIPWSKTWSAFFPKSTSWRRSSTLSSVRLKTRRTTCAFLRTSSKWLVLHRLNATLSLGVSAWHLVSSSSNSSTMCSSTWRVSVLTSSTTMTSIGISESHQQQRVNSKTQKKASCRFKMRSISRTIVTFLGSADATSWTKSLISLGRYTSTWKPPMKVFLCSTLSPMIATRWASSTLQWRLSMF